MSRTLAILFVFMTTSLPIGCTSYRSTIMSRLPTDQFVKNSRQCTKGVPVTLKVPTHVDVRVVEEYFIVQGGGETVIPQIGKPLRRVEMETIYTPKVLTVDFVRPAAGTLSLASDSDGNGIVLDEAGYFESIQGKIDDQTIEDLNAAIPNFKKLIGAPSRKQAAEVAAKGKNTELGGWHSYDAVIAVRRFDINEPCWEQEVDAFIAEHLACQSSSCFATVP
ncbi:hypothetical protein VN12_14340 [Pirellula sp. SH-Sr6A]|uniref:hypothetical protein n=1 Tax=Pirellula sp. SH-Sr6A TaxID=1632865 RepID=UPI00078E891D|nr:hypothetical protein [Pirellula sp. SH-Sr6A]AMV33302.1 hypothetical protein VN12_14340 [Pirellula sp. SH-Sr6A]